MSYKKLKLFEIQSFKEIIFSFLPESENNEEEKDFNSIIKKFLSNCLIDISLTSNLMAFAKDNYIQVYRLNIQNYDQVPKQSKANIICQIRLNLEKDDKITCISIIPLFYFGESDLFSDFPCIFIGFETGWVNIFTENLNKIFEFKFLDLPVLKFDFQTFYLNTFLDRDLEKENFFDEFLIYYYSSIIRIDGSKLTKLLKNNKSNFFKNANQENLSNQIFYEIWNFKKPKSVVDFVFKSNSFSSYYDNLANDSLIKNFKYSHCNNSKRVTSLVTAGTDPYVGFHEFILDKKDIDYISLFSNYIFSTDNEKFSLNNLTFVTGLFDENRIGKSIILSPNKNLALVCDRFDRIILIDIERRVMIRMWKGYPNCQCSFIQVNESKNIFKKALFVCFYLPDKGFLEIWPTLLGNIVSKIYVGLNCQLFYKNYYMFGMNTEKDFSKSLHDKFNRNTILFDLNTFECYILEVSFLCSLGDFCVTSKDGILMNEIPGIINMPLFKKKELDSVLVKIDEPENKLSVLKILIEKDDLNLLHYGISIFKSCYSRNSNEPFIINCNILSKLLFVYEKLSEVNQALEQYTIIKDINKDPPTNFKYESEVLKWKELDFSKIISLFSYGESLFPQNINLKSTNLSLVRFLSNFILSLEHCKTETCLINFKNEYALCLAHFMFSYLILIDKDINILDFFLSNCFKPLDLVYLLFMSWSTNEFVHSWKTWKNLFFISNYLILQHEKTFIENKKDFKIELMICLQKSCEILLNSKKIDSSIVGCYIIQIISNTFLIENKSNNEIVKIDDDWETINLKEESFSLVLKQLEDIYLLNLLLKLNFSENDSGLSLVILNKCKNFTIAELVSKFCVQNLIEANLITNDLFDPDDEEKNTFNLDCNFSSEIDVYLKKNYELNDDKTFVQLFNHVRIRFPFDLNPEIVLAYCAWFSIENFMQDACLSKKFYLQLCLNYLSEIKNSLLKHKMARLIWKCFIIKVFIKIKNNLFNQNNSFKVLKFENFYFEEATLEQFSQFIYDLLCFILNTIDTASSSDSFKYEYDDHWRFKKNNLYSVNEKPILELALSLPIAKHYIVLQHCHLALITYFLINFREKLNFKLEKIFPEAVVRNLPNDLSVELDEQFGDYHKKFQIEVLKNFATIVAKSVPSISTRLPSELEQKSFMQANSWISKLIELAKYWDININYVKNRFVYTLYKIGCDKLANEVLYTVNDEEFLGKMFISLITPRLFTLYGDDFYSKISLLPTEITNQFNKKKIEKVDFDINYVCTKEFIECILSKLSENSPYKNVITSVLELILQSRC